jgi:hypothetical protein
MVIEGRDDLSKAKLGSRSHFDQSGQTSYGKLEWQGYLLLDLGWIQSRRDGIDLHLDRCGVWKRIDGGVEHPPDSEAGAEREEDDDQQPVPEDEVDDLFKHGFRHHAYSSTQPAPSLDLRNSDLRVKL